MASATGGDIVEISYNHPTLGSGILSPKSAEDSTFDLGGYRGDDDANKVDGAGRTIRTLNRVRWSFEGPVSWDANISNELETLKKLAGDPVEADWTITSINGTVWKAKGAPVGDLQGSGQDATIDLKISGGGVMEKISG
jgi:hypothetical protein